MLENFFEKKRIGLLIISRFNSTRLKRKADLKVLNKNITEILIERLLKKFQKKSIVICTSKKNNNIAFYKRISKSYKIRVFFGPEKNVLKRIIECMKKNKFQHFVRITGDNPFTDINSIIKLAKEHIKNKNDYTFTNSLPNGMKPEIFSLKALIKNYSFIQDLNSTEYLTYFFLREDLYKIQKVKLKQFLKNQHFLNISIDKMKDFKLFKKLLEKFKSLHINSYKIILFLKKNSSFVKIKSKIPLKTSKYNARYHFDKKRFIFQI